MAFGLVAPAPAAGIVFATFAGRGRGRPSGPTPFPGIGPAIMPEPAAFPQAFRTNPLGSRPNNLAARGTPGGGPLSDQGSPRRIAEPRNRI
ncbi:MAG: hypothetical protein EA381_09360 [Planctomycetaceae bacterium]|nr:MAG: hypothetical protein EA381_09360 [Planctomycetaceae bacterium]